MNPYLKAGTNILRQIAETVKDVPADISAYIAGGLAVSYWLTGQRVSLDLDVIFSHRIILEQGLSAKVESQDSDFAELVDFDYNFTDVFSLVQADYPDRASHIATYGNLKVYVLAPVDLALMKLSRFTEKDRDDIHGLIDAGLIELAEFRSLAQDALRDYIGNFAVLQTTLEIVESWFPPEAEDRCAPLP